MAMQSAVRSGAETAAKNGLSDNVAEAWNMSRWRLLTGRSTGSTVPVAPWCSQGEA